MKIDDIIPEVEQVAPTVKEQRKELVLLTKLRPHKGQKIWEVNIETYVVKVAEYEKPDTVRFPLKKVKGVGKPLQGKLIAKKDCWYVCALNEYNAARKFIQFMEKLRKSNKI